MNNAVIPIIYALNHPNPLSYSLLFCKLQYYLRHAFSQSMRSFLVLACADRYATCNNRARTRLFSRYQIAIRIIPFVIVFWLILAIFPTMLYSITDGVYDAIHGVPDIMYSVYILIALGIFPTVSMITFGLLLAANLKGIRGRVQPMQGSINTTNILRKHDRDMLKMLLIELIVYTFTTLPNTVVLMYRLLTQSTIKSSDGQQIESFIFYLTRIFLLYLNNGLSFWIYLLISRSFRLELKNLILKFWSFIRKENLPPNRIH